MKYILQWILIALSIIIVLIPTGIWTIILMVIFWDWKIGDFFDNLITEVIKSCKV